MPHAAYPHLTPSNTRYIITRYQREQGASYAGRQGLCARGRSHAGAAARHRQGDHDVIVGVEKRPADSPTYVLINEIPARDWGVTGNVYTPRT